MKKFWYLFFSAVFMPLFAQASDAPFTALAYFKITPGNESAFLREASKLVEPTRAEPGNSAYFLHQSSNDPTEFMFYEQWKSQAALDLHLQKPYIVEFVAKTHSWIVSGYPKFERYRESTRYEMPTYEPITRQSPILELGVRFQVWETTAYSPEEEYWLSGVEALVRDINIRGSYIELNGVVSRHGSNCFSDARWTSGCSVPAETESVEIKVENAPAQSSVWDYYYGDAGASQGNPYPRHQRGELILRGSRREVRLPLFCTYGYVAQDTTMEDRKELSCSTHDAPHSVSFHAVVSAIN